jgi:predicted metal-dependent enzyme (double-stranded beta helix superfamily)
MDFDALIGALRSGVGAALRESAGIDGAVGRIRDFLHELVQGGEVRLPPRFHAVREEHYARRLLYRDSDNGTLAVVMTWGPGQCTPIHDHSGVWCVEGVVAGRMEVRQYDLTERCGELCKLIPAGRVLAEVGSTGALIPPFEYHVLSNLSDQTSLTLHIYGAEMDHCHIYEPADTGWYQRTERRLEFTP